LTPPLLFDLDGTLVDSRAVVERHWAAFCARHGLDFAAVLAVLHGVRSVDVIRAVAPGVDAEAEAALLDAAEEVDTDGLKVVPGAPELLARLSAATRGDRSATRGDRSATPGDRSATTGSGPHVAGQTPVLRGGWGIVTSGHRSLAQRRLCAVGLPVPAVMVCGDEVAKGKPDPEGFLTGARLLGVSPETCVAVEDAPPGVLAARAAGMPVIGITTTHAADALAGASTVIADLTEFGAALTALGHAAPRRPPR
jgi:sugar-phosphatase